jgi:hypothetical protein
MGAEALPSVEVSWHGLVGDRRWAFVRDGVERSGFPWLTLRDRANLALYRPVLTDPDRPDTSSTVVHTPSGAVVDVTDPALARELWPDGARILRQRGGIFDTFPLSLITTRTVAELGALAGRALDVQRFRPNVLVDAASDAPFPEDDWVGSVLRFGALRMRVDKRDGRCVVVNVDPVTTERDPVVLRTIADTRQGSLGVYGTTVEPGRVALGDSVLIEG